jgi:hypothetical protein
MDSNELYKLAQWAGAGARVALRITPGILTGQTEQC